VAHMEIEYCDIVLAPVDVALVIVAFSKDLEPALLSDCFRYRLFSFAGVLLSFRHCPSSR